MRFTSSIKNYPAKLWGLNLQEAYLFSFIYELPSWAEKIIIEGHVFYYGSRKKAIEEIPLLTDKPDTMYRHYKSLKEKGLIEYVPVNGKEYVRITEKGKLWNSSEIFPNARNQSDGSEIFPNQLGNFSESGSEIFPTDNNIINNNTTSNTNFLEKNLEKKESSKNQNLKNLESSKEKSSAKKERPPHPCNPNLLFGDYIPRHGDGELHEMMLEFVGQYPKQLLSDFKAYWVAKIINGKKSHIGLERWRTEKTFEVSLRLANWNRRNNNNQDERIKTNQQQQHGFNRNEVLEQAFAIANFNEGQREQHPDDDSGHF